MSGERLFTVGGLWWRMLRPFILLATISFVTPAAASPLLVQVLDAGGKPVQNVVVAFRPAGKAARPHVSAGYAIAQKDMQFRPFVAVVPVGATVSFPNLDPTKHHVYSFSAAKKFELKLFAKDQSRSIRFDKAGVVPLGCNIHDSMSAFLYVSDTAFAATTDGRGIVRFGDTPPTGTLTVWHPYLRSKGNQLVRMLGSTERAVKVAVRLRPPPMHSSSGY